jgi:hypothetical protein
MSTLADDLRYALRGLRSAPGFAAAAILSLALGIGANTTIFSVTNAALFSRIDAPEPERLARIVRGHHSALDAELIKYVGDNARSFSAVMGERMIAVSLTTDDGRADSFQGALVSNNYFEGLGLKPARGRFFAAAGEALAEQGSVVVLSHATWATRFGGDAASLAAPFASTSIRSW